MDTAAFLLEVEREISEPSYQARFSDDDILALASKHQRITVTPAILALQEDYFLTRSTETVLAGVSAVDIPVRATGRTILAIEASRNGQDWYQLPRAEVYASGWSYNENTTGEPSSHVFMGDQLRLLPTPSQDTFLAITYETKPSNLTLAANTATVTGSAGALYTVRRVPTNISIGTTVDVTGYRGGHRLLARDLTVIGATTTTLTLSDEIAVVAGDVISPTGTTSIVQLPDEAIDVLVSATGMQMLLSMGHADQAKVLKDNLEGAMSSMRTALSQRNQSSPQKIRLQGTVFARRAKRPWLVGGY